MGVDWGTTRLRARRMDAAGQVVDRRDRELGVRDLKRVDFAARLRDVVSDWLAEDPDMPVIASGVVGGQHGWLETPYLRCPVGERELAAGLVEVDDPVLSAALVPGVTHEPEGAPPDVMRGEETQIIGALDEAGSSEGTFVLPGTHSKWARVESARIASLSTFVTGELFAWLSEQSTLGGRGLQSDRVSEQQRVEAFDRGAELGLSLSRAAGGSLRRLFSARSLVGRGELRAEAVSDYLSGLCIGNETREALQAASPPEQVTLVGAPELCDRYARVLARAGIAARRTSPDVAARGQWRLAELAGRLSHRSDGVAP